MKEEIVINNFYAKVGQNQVLLTAIIAWAIAQIVKTAIAALEEKRLNFRRLVETGGMPSSHSTFVTSLATGIGVIEGWDTTMFALAAVFALVVMYDAAGVRRAAGRQARVLNMIVADINKKDFNPERLKELLGHTPVEVFVGALFGILFTLYRLK